MNTWLKRREFLRMGLLSSAGFLAGLGEWRLSEAYSQTAQRIPIEHLVIILRENHSYDNYFGTFSGGNGKVSGSRCEDEQPDPPHARNAALRGVTADSRGSCHYLEEDIPNYFVYARNFVLCDNYFGEFLGPSHPNYFMLMAAQTPITTNARTLVKGNYDLPTIADRLTEKGVSWKSYEGGIPLVSMFKGPFASGNIVPLANTTADAVGGKLPSVSWVSPSLRDSEHPPHSVRRGENWTVAKVNTVMQGPLWPKSAIFIVYDEWGGFWDHVEPPVVEKERVIFNLVSPLRYGYRIPCLIIAPYAKHGYVSHSLYSHMSILRTVEKIFDVPPLNERDAQANDMLDCFDFSQQPRPPLLLEEGR